MQRNQRREETGPLSYTIHKKLTQNKDLNVTPETIKLQKENLGSCLFNISLGDDFLNLTTKAEVPKIYKQMRLHQTKKFLHS